MTTRSIISKLLILTVTVVGIFFALQVRLAEDVLDMLPGQALQGDLRTLQQLGMINRVFISLEAENASVEALLASAGKLGEQLSASPLLKEVFYRLPEGYEFRLARELEDFLPALTNENDLQRFVELIEPEELRRQLRDDYLQLNSLAGLAMVSHIRQDPLNLTGLVLRKMTALRGGMKLAIRDGFFVGNDGKECLLWAESIEPLTVSANAFAIGQEIDLALLTSLRPGVKARIIGPLAHTVANAETIRRDLARLLPAAAALLMLFLLVLFRDLRALLVIAIPFLAAPLAIALLAAVYGTVSAMALGFGIVLLGIGVDFAVHIYVGCEPGPGRAKIPPGLRKSLLMAFVTTISVFVVLLLSKVVAHRQMALLAIFGLSWALLLAWQLVPTLAGRFAGSEKWARLLVVPDKSSGRRWRSLKLLVWISLLVAGLGAWPFLHYNGDLRAFDVPSASVSGDEQHFAATWGQAGEQAFIVASGSDQGKVLDINEAVYGFLKAEDRLAGVQSLSPVLPGPQRQEKNIAAWQTFWAERIVELDRDIQKAAVETGFTSQAFRPFIERLEMQPRKIRPDDLLAGPLRPFISSLFREVDDRSGKFFLAATMVPDEPTTSSFFDQLTRAVPGATVLSNSRWRQEVETEIKGDIVRLSMIAAVLVLFICAVFFRKVRPVLAVLAPVLSALSAMALFSLLTGGELNLMHVLMGIMVIGLSVDYGIFIAGAYLEGFDRKAFTAVSICAVSTLTGFGVLGFAEHPVLHALGVTVLAGISAAWPTALLLTPVILNQPPGKGGEG